MRFRPRILAAALVATAISVAGFFSAVAADPAPPPDTNAPASTPPVAANANKPATTGAPAAPDYFNRYGKILTSSNEAAHPLRLNLPIPEVGEVKIPNQDEMTMRQKLEALATLSDEDIRAQLNAWPAYNKMKLGDQGAMLSRIQQFKDRRSRIAQDKAHQMGLSTLTPEQQQRFEKEYWNRRLEMNSELAKLFAPIYRDRETKIQADLFREFSSPTPSGAVSQAPKPPAANSPAAIASPAGETKPAAAQR